VVEGSAFRGARRPLEGAKPSPEQLREMGAAEQDRIAEHEAKDAARYDAMTPAQRDKTFVRPGLMTRIKQFWFGV
jgi:hypothetical protein